MAKSFSEAPGALRAFSDELAAIVERAGACVVAVNGRPHTPSSGVYWHEGVVVTASHTLKRDEEITVALHDGRILPATLAGRDHGTDLAALRVEPARVPLAPTGDAAPLKAGHLVVALGRRESAQGSRGISFGFISAISGSWRTWAGGRIDSFLRADLSIFMGFSGGPLVDADGRVVGINTTGLWRRAGITIPTATVERVTRELLEKGHVSQGYLGIGMQPARLPETLRSKLSLDSQTGLILVAVEPGSPAEGAGVLIGDILIGLEGKPVTDVEGVQTALAATAAGQSLSASLVRGGARMSLSLTVGERPHKGRQSHAN